MAAQRFNESVGRLQTRRLDRRSFLTGSVALGISACTAANVLRVTSAAAQGTPASTLTIAIDTDPAKLEPGTNLATPVDSEAIINIFDTLVAWKAPDFKQLEGRLAESWTISPDVTTYTFKLRSGIKFHDGTPFDAAAVKFSFERTKKINPYMAAYFGPISNIQTPDGGTITIKLKEPSAVFLSWLAMPQAAVVSPTAVKKFGDSFTTHPVGTGAFIFDSYTPNTALVLKANPSYFRGAPKLQEIVYKVIPDASTRRLEIEAGSVDLVQQNSQLSAIPTEDVKALQGNPNIDVLQQPSQIIRDIDFNNNNLHSPVADIRVRQAFSYAVDYDSLVTGLWGNTAVRVYGPLPTSSWAFDPKMKANAYQRDIPKAKSLLAAAGYGKDKPLSLTMYTFQGSSWSDVGTLLQANLADAGIQVKVEQLEFPQLHTIHTGGKFDIALDGRQPWYNDPDAQIGIGYLSSLAGTALNFRMPPDPAIDNLILKAETTVGQAARTPLYYQIQEDLMAKVPGVYLFSPNLIVYKRKGVEGLVINSAPPLTEYWSVSKQSS